MRAQTRRRPRTRRRNLIRRAPRRALCRREGSPAAPGPRGIASAFSCAFKGAVGQREVPARGTGREFAPPEPPRGLAGRWLFGILAPACIALLIATVMLWRENTRLTSQLAVLGVSVDKTQKQLADTQEMLHLYSSKDTIKVLLAPKPGMVKGDGEVMYNEKMGLLMYDGWIAPSPDDKSYQLWVVPMEGKPISAGVFNPATSDTAHWMAKVPEGIAPKMFAITLEPAGGMPQPTGPMVLVGGT